MKVFETDLIPQQTEVLFYSTFV